VVAPLISVAAIDQAEPDLSDVAALAFTSVNGATAFAALTARRELPVFAVGDATAAAAREAGFVQVVSADGALADLARLLEARGIAGVILAPMAREPAGDLAGMAPSLRVRPLAVYAASETGAEAPAEVDAVLLHSPRGARALAALWPTMAGRPRVFCLSEAVADPMRPLVSPVVAAQPRETDLLEALGNPAPRV
jgi:uroporphyrinogen-III synthase